MVDIYDTDHAIRVYNYFYPLSETEIRKFPFIFTPLYMHAYRWKYVHTEPIDVANGPGIDKTHQNWSTQTWG